MQHAVNALARTRTPFGGALRLERPGVHTVWIEGDCLSCVGNSAAEYRDAATVSVVGPRGTELPLTPAPDRLYNTGGTEGRALWTFVAPAAGEHRITLGFDTSGEWDNRLPARIAVGPGEGLPARIAAPTAWLSAVGVASAVAWALVWRTRRERWFRSRLQGGDRPSGAGLA